MNMSDLQEPSPDRDNDSMSSVVGLEFVDQISDVEIDRGFLEIERRPAICRLRWPSRINVNTSSSRVVRSSVPRCSARRTATSAEYSCARRERNEWSLADRSWPCLQDIGSRSSTESALNGGVSIRAAPA